MTSLTSNDRDVLVEGKYCRLYLDQTALPANSPSFCPMEDCRQAQ